MGNDSGIRCEAYYRLCYEIVQRVTCMNAAQGADIYHEEEYLESGD